MNLRANHSTLKASVPKIGKRIERLLDYQPSIFSGDNFVYV